MSAHPERPGSYFVHVHGEELTLKGEESAPDLKRDVLIGAFAIGEAEQLNDQLDDDQDHDQGGDSDTPAG